MPITIKISLLLSLCFMVSEGLLVITKHSGRKSTEARNDRGSLILLWVAITIGLTAGFRMARGPYPAWHVIDYVIATCGIAIAIPGFVIRWASVIQLKRGFTVDVSISKSHELKTDGLYRTVRHPSYFGLLLIMTGEAISMVSLISFVCVVLPVSLAIMYRISLEEKILKDHFGEAYTDYSRRTKRIIPFLL
jgi:protein-S-isoprenylcysteine O-methyltransferase Ste14